MKRLKILLIVIMVGAALWVWPVHPFREVYAVRSGDKGHVLTKPVGIGESITQYFTTEDNNIIQIEFALDFDGAQPQTGELLFELLDQSGNAVFMQTLKYADISDYLYYGPPVNVRVKKGKQYAYRLTNLNISENQPCGVYTTDQSMYCLKMGELVVNGQPFEGELITRITTNSPLTAENTLAVWGSIGMVGFILYEALERVEKRRVKKS